MDLTKGMVSILSTGAEAALGAPTSLVQGEGEVR